MTGSPGPSPPEPASGRAAPAAPEGVVGRFLSPSTDAIVLAVILLVCVQIGMAPLKDNSFLTHIATGRLIIDSGSVPTADPYSWTAHGDPWIVQSWLASVIYAGIEDVVGLVGVRVLSTLLTMALAVLLWKLTDRAGSLLSRAVAASLPLLVGVDMWVERPYMFGAIGLALVLLAAEDRLDPRWLVPILWVWANTHGSFPFAPGVLVLLAAGRFLDERTRPDIELRCLAWTMLGTALAVVGPLGTKVLTFPFQLLGKSEAFTEVREWQPLDFGSTFGRVFALQLLVAAIALVRVRRWRAAIPAVVFGIAAVASARNVVQASIVLTPVIAVGLHGLGSIDGSVRARLARPIVHALTIVMVVIFAVQVTGPDTELGPYPEDAAEWMRSEGLLDTSSRVVAREVVGNYLEFTYGPDEVRVFMDDRVDMFPLDLVKAYLEMLDEDADHGEVLARFDPTAVLWDQDSPLGRWIEASDAWEVRWRDDTWLVAVPAGSGGGSEG